MLKKLLHKMGLISKGKNVTGEKGKALRLEKEAQKKSNDDNTLTNKEVDFILAKLRQANYTGVEFETFYIVFKKLGDMKK